ncbi:MAG TPA: hypothetical protein VJB05_02620 [archaeon]|nr:hypothetical protein [archaeon]
MPITNNNTMYNSEVVDHTLDSKYMTDMVKNAQITEFRQLKNIIEKIYLETGRHISILDIGVGYGRIPLLLSRDPIWRKIKMFIGFDNSLFELQRAKYTIRGKIKNKTRIIYHDARDIYKKPINKIFRIKYDLVICTYFTPGNFKPLEIKLDTSKAGRIKKYPKNLLRPNMEFVKIFKNAYKLLNPSGKLVLTIYNQSDENRIEQEKFYKKCRMHVITGKNDIFTATKEGFWSQRFTKEMIYEHFRWLQKGNIEFIPLDACNFAQIVIISKNPFGTLKDRRSEMIVKRAMEKGIGRLCLITSGNAGYSLARISGNKPF